MLKDYIMVECNGPIENIVSHRTRVFFAAHAAKDSLAKAENFIKKHRMDLNMTVFTLDEDRSTETEEKWKWAKSYKASKWVEIKNDYIEEDGKFGILHIDAFKHYLDDHSEGETIAKLVGVLINDDVHIHPVILNPNATSDIIVNENIEEGYALLSEYLKKQ